MTLRTNRNNLLHVGLNVKSYNGMACSELHLGLLPAPRSILNATHGVARDQKLLIRGNDVHPDS